MLQQITGINAVYFYATSICEQTGIGTDAAFSSGVLLSTISVVFTFVAIYLIDRTGRRPLLLVGTAGIAIGLLLCAYGLNTATYQLSKEEINQFDFTDSEKLLPFAIKIHENDISSIISSLKQLIFPWELSNLGNAFTFFLFGVIALIGFFILVKILP